MIYLHFFPSDFLHSMPDSSLRERGVTPNESAIGTLIWLLSVILSGKHCYLSLNTTKK